MDAPKRPIRFPLHRLIAVSLVAVGAAAAAISYQIGRHDEYERARMEFTRRALVRQALTREVLGRYEDSLFGLSALFMLDASVTRAEFIRATSRLEQRIQGAQAFQWVPFVTHENRGEVETAMRRAHPDGFEIRQFDPAGRAVRATDRPAYYPICYIQPLRGNEAALGYDLMTAPTRRFLESARETRQATVSSQFRLVQEQFDQLGVVMIWPVYRASSSTASEAGASGTAGAPPPATPSPAEETFIGFLQCVFRVHDLLEHARAPQADTMMDMLFIDGSENDPARRTLYYRPADDTASRAPVASEAGFRREMHLEYSLPFGQRDWQVIYRPRADWLADQYSVTPLLRSGSFLLLAGLLAGLVHLTGRRTEIIQHEVDERTAELAESRRQFSTLVHALPGMAYRGTYDREFDVTFVSEGAFALTGWRAGEFVAGAVHFRDVIHPEDLARVREATLTAVRDQTDAEIEYRIRTRDGAEKWVLTRNRGLPSETGTPRRLEGLAIDITAQKSAEAARLTLERKLLEGQKLESLGLLAGGIAHDFNNLLSSILGNASMSRLTLGQNSVADAQLRAIESASLRAAELCRQMLAYAGKGRFVVEPLDLSALVEDLLPLLRISIARQATLELKLVRSLPSVMADATQLRQIVMNLVLNAADAIAPSTQSPGEIAISTGVMHADATLFSRCAVGAGLSAGEYVFLEVRDTGCGMTPEVMGKIFDPFFTTKFSGRGLGLAAALGIVRGHQGALHVESAPGRGSTFRLLLPPVPRAQAGVRPADTATAEPWTHGGLALVIDDEDAVRFITAELVKSLGFTSHSAASGTAGLAFFRENPAAVTVVVLDLLMPGLNGEQTLAALRAIRADVPVLLVSGYSEGDLLRRLGGAGPLAFVAKPFSRDTLAEKLRALLG